MGIITSIRPVGLFLPFLMFGINFRRASLSSKRMTLLMCFYDKSKATTNIQIA